MGVKIGRFNFVRVTIVSCDLVGIKVGSCNFVGERLGVVILWG